MFTEHGLTNNDGSIPVMGADQRICVVDLQAQVKRGKTYNAPDPERDANGRLIAAAPELLEACKKQAALIEALMPGLKHIAVQDYALVNDAPMAAEAAIAKAEGRS
jgi:hypothetical protein